jgi:hypothetical protein
MEKEWKKGINARKKGETGKHKYKESYSVEKEGKREIKRGKENISKKGEIKEKMLYIFYKIRKKALKMDQFCLEFSKKSRLPNPSEPRPYKKGGRKNSIQNSGWGKKSMSRYYIYPRLVVVIFMCQRVWVCCSSVRVEELRVRFRN